jgi:hypothetical protein
MSRVFFPRDSHRQLRHEPEYDAQIAELEHHPRMSEVIIGIEGGIAVRAEEFDEIPDPPVPGLRMAASDAVGGAPPIRVFFSIDSDDQVTLWYAEIDGPTGEAD